MISRGCLWGSLGVGGSTAPPVSGGGWRRTTDPNSLEVDGVVLVNQHIPQRCHPSPAYGGVCLSEVIGNPIRRLTRSPASDELPQPSATTWIGGMGHLEASVCLAVHLPSSQGDHHGLLALLLGGTACVHEPLGDIRHGRT